MTVYKNNETLTEPEENCNDYNDDDDVTAVNDDDDEKFHHKYAITIHSHHPLCRPIIIKH